jgi:hypothetical protein
MRDLRGRCRVFRPVTVSVALDLTSLALPPVLLSAYLLVLYAALRWGHPSPDRYPGSS